MIEDTNYICQFQNNCLYFFQRSFLYYNLNICFLQC